MYLFDRDELQKKRTLLITPGGVPVTDPGRTGKYRRFPPSTIEVIVRVLAWG